MARRAHGHGVQPRPRQVAHGDRVFVTGPGFGVIADGVWRDLVAAPAAGLWPIPENIDDDHAPDNQRIVDAIARVTPVWDFDRPAWLSERADLWLDFSHYSPTVAALMMRRVFGHPTAAPADFGQLRGP